jgi:hypothetical protein
MTEMKKDAFCSDGGEESQLATCNYSEKSCSQKDAESV